MRLAQKRRAAQENRKRNWSEILTLIKFKKKTICFTRNKWRWVIVLLITVALLFTVVLDTSIFDSRKTVSYVGKNARSIGVLNGETPFVQPFIPEKEHVDFVEIRFSTNTEPVNVLAPQGYLEFQLLDRNNEVLKEHRVQIKEMKENEYLRFALDLDLDTELVYNITLRVFGTVGEEVPTVWLSNNVQDALRSVTYPGCNETVHLLFRNGLSGNDHQYLPPASLLGRGFAQCASVRERQ